MTPEVERSEHQAREEVGGREQGVAPAWTESALRDASGERRLERAAETISSATDQSAIAVRSRSGSGVAMG